MDGYVNTNDVFTIVIRYPRYVCKRKVSYACGEVEIESDGYHYIVPDGCMRIRSNVDALEMLYGKVGMRGDLECLMEKLHTKI